MLSTRLNCPLRAAPLALLTALVLAAPAQATQLTFEGIGNLGGSSNPGFGDRVTSAGTGLNLNGGATPNVVLDFVPTGTTQPFTVYANGYSGMVSALGHGQFNVPGYVEFRPDPGWDVELVSFDLGGWSSSSYPNSRVQVVDTAGTVYFDTGFFTWPANVVTTYITEVRSTLPLRLVVQDFGDLGLDNVLFRQVATIPEPGTWALWLAGGAMLAGLARRRKD